MKKVFVTQALPSGKIAKVYQISALDMMKCAMECKGDMMIIPYHLIVQCVEIDGKKLPNIEALEDLMMEDATLIFEAINAQLIKVK